MEQQKKSSRQRNYTEKIGEGRNPYLEDYAVRRRRRNRRRAVIRHRRTRLIQATALGLWILCILLLAIHFIAQNNRVSAVDARQDTPDASISGAEILPNNGNSQTIIQGIAAEVFAAHPDWEENFLTPNEYSRPGDALEEVNSIFVHYTANPGTSAAQNRSYFERQKDEHQQSVSAHFIIGYEGEIIQCIPLDEIAYAVKTRNYDSISIECCHLKEDGSFTQETYDSLVRLLAWLMDAYDLDTGDILRHYDCGGKKCPLYYVEHEGAWEQLKKDVDKQ